MTVFRQAVVARTGMRVCSRDLLTALPKGTVPRGAGCPMVARPAKRGIHPTQRRIVSRHQVCRVHFKVISPANGREVRFDRLLVMLHY
jgi:hypothetical protein